MGPTNHLLLLHVTRLSRVALHTNLLLSPFRLQVLIEEGELALIRVLPMLTLLKAVPLMRICNVGEGLAGFLESRSKFLRFLRGNLRILLAMQYQQRSFDSLYIREHIGLAVDCRL